MASIMSDSAAQLLMMMTDTSHCGRLRFMPPPCVPHHRTLQQAKPAPQICSRIVTAASSSCCVREAITMTNVYEHLELLMTSRTRGR
jgi:hypothetical protein